MQTLCPASSQKTCLWSTEEEKRDGADYGDYLYLNEHALITGGQGKEQVRISTLPSGSFWKPSEQPVWGEKRGADPEATLSPEAFGTKLRGAI